MANLSITATGVLASANAGVKIIKLAAGVTVTQGQALYQLADGTGGLADANATTPANSVIGIACSAGSPGQWITYCELDSAFVLGATGMAVAPVYLSSSTAGALTQTLADLAAGSTCIVVGIAVSGTVLNLTPPGGVTSLAGVTS